MCLMNVILLKRGIKYEFNEAGITFFPETDLLWAQQSFSI